MSTQYTIFNMNMKNTLNYPKSAAMGFFQGTQESVRNSRGKLAISVRAIEVLLYFFHGKKKEKRLRIFPIPFVIWSSGASFLRAHISSIFIYFLSTDIKYVTDSR